MAQTHVVAWGENYSGQCDVPVLPAGLSYVEVAAGYEHNVARISDGTVVTWGDTGGINVPALPPGITYVEVAAGARHSVARRSDGTVVAWGGNTSGECNVPPLPPGLTYVEVAAGLGYTLARVSDGTLLAWGRISSAPNPPSGLTYVEVAAGADHAVARLSDGTVVAWGSNSFGQCNIPPPPSGLTYVEVAAGPAHTLALLSDGSVIARGLNSVGECSVPALPVGVRYAGVAAGGGYFSSVDMCKSVARRSDGSIVIWGQSFASQPALSGLTCLGIATGVWHTVALLEDADCNHNGKRDDIDIQAGSSLDCNGNGIPDECDLLQGTGADCDGNGVLDVCEIAANPSLDLNHDDRLDSCPLNCQPYWRTDIGGRAGMDGDVQAMIVYDDGTGPALFVGGSFHSANGMPANGVAKWDGAAWTALGSGISGGYAYVDAFAVCDDGSGPALFVGGSFTSAGGVAASNIARWDGASWTALGSGSGCTVNALATFDAGSGQKLYLYGCGLSVWNGSSLSSVSSAPPSLRMPETFAMLVYDDGSGPALYLGGRFGPSPAMVRWDGNSWTELPPPPGYEFVGSLAEHTDASGAHLYAGTEGDGTVARWDGTTWSVVGKLLTGNSGQYSHASSLSSFDDGTGPALYVCGLFSSVAGVPASNFARWDGHRWSGVAEGIIGVEDDVTSLCTFDDGSGPSLYAGVSSWVNGVSVNHLASWGLPGGCVPAGSVICEPGLNGVMACPCANPPSGPGRGCNNSSNAGGASLTTVGFARLGTDNLVFTTTREKPGALSVLLQGGTNNASGQVFGQGVRCVSNPFKRLFIKSAIAGSVTVPAPGEASISTRSAALGAPIASGARRYYGVYYRDPILLGGCPAPSTFNMTQQLEVLWHP